MQRAEVELDRSCGADQTPHRQHEARTPGLLFHWIAVDRERQRQLGKRQAIPAHRQQLPVGGASPLATLEVGQLAALARAPEGHTVCVVDEAALEEDA